MNFLSWLSGLGGPIAGTFVTVYGAFYFFEMHLNDDTRRALTNFLKQRRYESHLGVLPAIVESTFSRVFGTKHLSIRCIGASIALSVMALIVSFGFTALYHPQAFVTSSLQYGSGLDTIVSAWRDAETTRDMAAALDRLRQYPLWLLVPIAWLFWYLLPDYVALLKARIVLIVIKAIQPGFGSLLVTVMTDFFISTCAFLAFLVLPVASFAAVYISQSEAAQLQHLPAYMIAIVFGGELLSVFLAVMVPTGAVYQHFPLANLFWASVCPSMWMYIYVLAAFATRALIETRPLFRWSFRILNIEEHPLRSTGLVAALMSSAAVALVLALRAVAP